MISQRVNASCTDASMGLFLCIGGSARVAEGPGGVLRGDGRGRDLKMEHGKWPHPRHAEAKAQGPGLRHGLLTLVKGYYTGSRFPQQQAV